MGIFDFFKNKGKDTQKELTLEDCIIKMFASADIEPHREGDEFSFKVQGEYCVFNVTLSYEANRIIVCIPFPIPVNRKVAKSSMYEVKRIDSFVQKGDSFYTTVCQIDKDKEYQIRAATLNFSVSLTEDTPDIIQKMVTRTVDVIDGDNFASLAAAIFGCKSCDKTKTGWQNKSTGNIKMLVQQKDDYHKLLDNVPNLSSARYRGRLIAYATYIINYKSDKEVAERSAKESSSNYYDRFIQEAYNIANEEERDLIRKLRFLVEKKYGTKNEDFVMGQKEATEIICGNPWNLLYQDENTYDTDISEEEKLYKRLCAPQYKDRPYKQRDLGENMTLVNQVIGKYWKPRYLMDNEAKCACEFMSIDEVLQIVTDEDIDWDSLKGLPQDAFERAKAHSFHFPGHVYQYKNGVAEVEWQLNPDGMYYRDEDGFGMTDDEEINLYGAIDRKGKVVKKFTLKR